MVSLSFFGDGRTGDGLIDGRWIVSGIVFVLCTAIAYFLNFRRMYLYALLFVGAFNLSEIIRENPGVIPDGAFAYRERPGRCQIKRGNTLNIWLDTGIIERYLVIC